MLRSISRTQLVVDIVVAGAVLLLFVWSAAAQAPFIGTLVALVACAALAVRRLSPGIALIGVWAAALLQMAALHTVTPVDVAILGVLYATASYGGRVLRWLGLASAVIGGVIAALYLSLFTGSGFAVPPSDLARWLVVVTALTVGVVTLFGLSWTLGLLARTIRLSREARIQAAVSAQRAAYESAIEQERTRIARDMHDVVAHSLAVVIAQADGARYVGAANPELQAEALSTISATARSALGEVRVLLTQLRSEEPEGPQPSLDDLPALLDGMRRAGLRVVDSTTGAPRRLMQGSGLAAYRILQEALTNALRHGDLSRQVNVELNWERDALRIRVRNGMRLDTGGQTPAEGVRTAGHGLPGMHERAALAGGSLSAGVVASAAPQYEVVVVLPAAPTEEKVS